MCKNSSFCEYRARKNETMCDGKSIVVQDTVKRTQELRNLRLRMRDKVHAQREKKRLVEITKEINDRLVILCFVRGTSTSSGGW